MKWLCGILLLWIGSTAIAVAADGKALSALCERKTEQPFADPQTSAVASDARGTMLAPDHQSWIEHLYQIGDYHRAESELLRMLYMAPDHPSRFSVALARAKLHYQQKRYSRSRVMLIALLDRLQVQATADPASTPRFQPAERCTYRQAARLLVLSELRKQNWNAAFASAEHYVDHGYSKTMVRSLTVSLQNTKQDEARVSSALNWSLFLPGAGYFLLDQPGFGIMAALSTVTVWSGSYFRYQREDKIGALGLGLLGLGLHLGAREGVREMGAEQLQQQQQLRAEKWLTPLEKPLLRFSFSL